jgi:hypothetical protein
MVIFLLCYTINVTNMFAEKQGLDGGSLVPGGRAAGPHVDTTITNVTETPTEPPTTTEETTTDGAGLAYASAITLTALCVAAMVL